MNYQYFGLFLNEHNRNELMKIIFANPIIANLVLLQGWNSIPEAAYYSRVL